MKIQKQIRMLPILIEKITCPILEKDNFIYLFLYLLHCFRLVKWCSFFTLFVSI